LSPKLSLPLLESRMSLPALANADQLARLVADLDSERFAVRQEAAQALEKHGDAAEGYVRKVLTGNHPLEVRRRLEQFLEKQDKDVIRKLRAIETLAQIDTRESRQVLKRLAAGAPNPRVAEAAVWALQRLARRPQ
jgi:HEAT repeat protein